tara:strand:- start:2486 stop:2881 length:396 start_codon:yes stop_codon:yes gene_type:complete
MIRILSGPELADQWHIIKPQIEEAIVHGSGVVTSHGLFLQCLGAVGQCWVRDEGGVCITRFEEIEGRRQLAVVACTSYGLLEFLTECMELFEEFAKLNNCKRTVVYGRKGWSKVLNKYGYHEPFITLIKEV